MHKARIQGLSFPRLTLHFETYHQQSEQAQEPNFNKDRDTMHFNIAQQSYKIYLNIWLFIQSLC